MAAGSLVPRLRRTSLSGLWIAGIGFFGTRFTVTLAAYEDPERFLLAGVVPLVLGLSLAIFGVALAVGSFEPAFVRTVATWSIVGAGTMLVLVVLTLLGSEPSGAAGFESIRSRTYLANFLIGGSIGGTLTGVYAGWNERQRRALGQQANRLVTLNRLLRHDVLNAMAIIRATVEEIGDRRDRVAESHEIDRVMDWSHQIVETVEDVKHLTETAPSTERTIHRLDLVSCVENGLDRVRERYPGAEYVWIAKPSDRVEVWANARLEHAVRNLTENAIVHTEADAPEIRVGVEAGGATATVVVEDDGPGLPEDRRATLEHGDISDFDDPSAGFGLNVVRLLVEQYDGDIRTAVSEEGTRVEIVLPRVGGGPPPHADPTDVRAYGVEVPELAVAAWASIIAGGLMGVVIQSTAGVVPVIGALYGASDPLVGWITHEFHSIVFGLVFAGIALVAPSWLVSRLRGCVGLGVAWGLFLWLVAAGFVMPIWFRLLGLPATIPNLTPVSFAGHLVWGASLATLYHLGVSVLPRTRDADADSFATDADAHAD